MNILITSAGRRVSLLNAFRSELKKFFAGGQVFASDSNPRLSAACQIADKYFEVPKIDSPDFIDSLLDICVRNEIKLVIPTIDTELLILAENKDKFEAQGIHLLISDLDFVRVCRNKRDVHDFFERHDIQVAKEFMKADFKLPIFIKPIDGSGGANAEAILSQEQMKERHILDNNLMFLEYFDKVDYDEFTCDLYYDRAGKLRCVVPRKRLEVREGEVSKALTVRNGLEAFIRERLGEIKGACGCLTLQVFKRKESKEVIGIEINPRFGGGYPLSYQAGANYPNWIIKEYFMDEAIGDQFDSWESGLLMLRFDQEILTHGYKG